MGVRIINADVFDGLAQLPDESVHCCITSPPYWGLRSYLPEDHPDKAKEIGQEPTLAEHIDVLVRVVREVRRVLRKDGTLWLNYGDAYAGGGRGGGADGSKQQTNVGALLSRKIVTESFKAKDLMMMPARLAIALCDDGWWLRSDIIWHKLNPMPESCRDRPTTAHEHIFLLAKSERYFYDADAIRESSITGDMRRPYGSQGAWEMDGRPPEQRHGGKPRKVKIPGGWDLGEGAHGTIHRDGRTSATYTEAPITEGRNIRNVWPMATSPFPEAHFATFPPELVERCIKAGTSERGCCAKCGSPWVRETAVSYDNPGNRTTNGKRSLENRSQTAGFAVRLEKRTETKGWLPSCECETDVVPCTVLDTFGGSGTTGMVADRLQRNAILIDLSDGYAGMSERRIKDDCPLFASIDARQEVLF